MRDKPLLSFLSLKILLPTKIGPIRMEAKNQIPSRLFYAEVAGPICKCRNVVRVFVCVCAAHCFMLCFVGFRLELTLPSKGVSHLFMTNVKCT